MKNKNIMIIFVGIVVMTLLTSGIASAGFFDWLKSGFTGNAVAGDFDLVCDCCGECLVQDSNGDWMVLFSSGCENSCWQEYSNGDAVGKKETQSAEVCLDKLSDRAQDYYGSTCDPEVDCCLCVVNGYYNPDVCSELIGAGEARICLDWAKTNLVETAAGDYFDSKYICDNHEPVYYDCCDCWDGNSMESNLCLDVPMSYFTDTCQENFDATVCGEKDVDGRCYNKIDDDKDLIWGEIIINEEPVVSIIGGGIDYAGGCVFIQNFDSLTVNVLNTMHIELDQTAAEISKEDCLAQGGQFIIPDECCSDPKFADEWGFPAQGLTHLAYFQCGDGYDNDGDIGTVDVGGVDGGIDWGGACKFIVGTTVVIKTCNLHPMETNRAMSVDTCVIDYGSDYLDMGGYVYCGSMTSPGFISPDMRCETPFFYENGYVANSQEDEHVLLESVEIESQNWVIALFT